MQYPKVYLYRRIVKSKLYIDANFGESIDLNKIAEEAFFSRYHFIRIFKKVYGKTPHKYLITVRIEKAKLFLEDGNSIGDVCYSVGFDSVTSFTGLFRKIAGITPSAYRSRALAMREGIKTDPLKYIPGCFAEKKGWNNISLNG